MDAEAAKLIGAGLAAIGAGLAAGGEHSVVHPDDRHYPARAAGMRHPGLCFCTFDFALH